MFRAESFRLAVDKRANNGHGELQGTPNSPLIGGTSTVDGSLGFPAVAGGGTAPKSHVRGKSRASRRVVRVDPNILASEVHCGSRRGREKKTKTKTKTEFGVIYRALFILGVQLLFLVKQSSGGRAATGAAALPVRIEIVWERTH